MRGQIGFAHGTSHAAWEHTARTFSSLLPSSVPPPPSPADLSPLSLHTSLPTHNRLLFSGSSIPCTEDRPVFTAQALRAIHDWEGGQLGGFWVHPGADGMQITVDEEGQEVKDDLYDVQQ